MRPSSISTLRAAALYACIPSGLFIGRAHAAGDLVAGNLIRFNDNGAWSWYEDERAIISNGYLLASSIADTSGNGGGARDGNVDLAYYNLNTREGSWLTLADIQADDHNTAALLTRPDGRLLAVYANHGSDNLTRWRVSTNPGDPTSWSAEQTFNNGVGATYSNVFHLSAQNKTYNFTRTNGYDPNFLVSTDQGSNWSYGGHLLRDPGSSNSGRPYVKYASNNVDRVYFITTEQHPRDYNNGIYAGYVQGGNTYKMDGTLIGPTGTSVATAPSATEFTTVFAQNTVVNGTTRTHAWTTDLALDDNGNPYGIFTSRVNSNNLDHRFYYARWDGAQWNVNELAKAGSYLYSAEGDYTGLVALDPNDPNTVYMSTKINPLTDTATGRYEIYKGVTKTEGASWSWTPITQNSTVDNLRPIMPRSDGATRALLWMRGNYTSYTDFDLSIVGLVTTPGSDVAAPIQYVDATLSNTARTSGVGTWTSSEPTGTAGATDGLWHRRTGNYNGGEIFTADEVGSENAPTLRTTATGLTPAAYDVYAFFWSDDDEAWQLVAGLAPSTMSFFEKQSSQHVELSDLIGATSVEATAGDHLMYKVYLGRTQVNGSGILNVYIDDGSGSIGSRTWYDGIGYAMAALDWTGAAGATWANNANWIGGSPNAANLTASFATVASGNYTITLPEAKTLGAMNFNSASSYTIGVTGGPGLTLQTLTGQAAINVQTGHHTIAAPLTLASDTMLVINSGAKLTLGDPTDAEGRIVRKAGSGSLELTSINADVFDVYSGNVKVTAGATANSSASEVNKLYIAAGASLDLTNSALVHSYSSLGELPETIREMLQSGRMTTSLSAGGYALGFADNAVLGLSEFAGVEVSAESMLIAYTLVGDANLDGKVNTLDFNPLAGAFGAASGMTWDDGDFNYDGAITSEDFNALVGNFGRSLPFGSAGVAGSSVPEPCSACFAGIAIGLLHRRRKPAPTA